MSHSLTTTQNTFLFIAITNLIFGSFWTTVTSQSSTRQNFCEESFVNVVTTKCISCDTAPSEACGKYQLIPSSKDTCAYIDSGTELQGCQWACEHNITKRVCCPGFWGHSCLECPGGADNPCYGNGVCMNGKCTCDPKYSGEECERCSEQLVFGANCTDCTCLHGTCDSGILGTGKCECESGFKGPLCAEEILGCRNIYCGQNENCREDDEGNPACKCENGYEKNENSECQAQSACASSPCPLNSNCVDLAQGKYDCICHENYKNIGRRRCAPINPCAMNNGGCLIENSYCVFLGPGQRECRCNRGYKWIDETGCRLKDLCLTKPYPCHKYAMCKTIPPEELSCVCKEGYIGNGRTECIGNLVNQIADMNDEDPIGKTRLYRFLTMLQTVYKGELTKHGNYTVFVPLDRGFNNLLQNINFSEFLKNSDHVRQILRQHIFPVRVYIDDLTDNIFYTLQGNFARFFYKGEKLLLKFLGSSRRSRVLSIYRDTRASNGLIHIVNNLMMNEPEIPGNLSKNFMTYVMEHPDFKEFGSWIMRTGLEKQFRQENITVFLPSKTSLDKIPQNMMDYLKSKNGMGALINLVKNHILKTKRTITDLIDSKKMHSLGNTAFRIKISSNGQIHFGPNANMTQSDVPVKNGIVHLIEGLLFPDNLETLLPHDCDNVTFQDVYGECGLCESDLRCMESSDIPTDKIYKNCTYRINFKYTYNMRKGCKRLCRRKIIDRQCCQGFFGPNCEPCPGGLNNPCYGRGTCFDGINGNGTCKCKEGFGKEACRDCAADDVFGPQCTEKCMCRYGECDSGINGKGQCKKYSCHVGFKGRNCDRQITSCNGKVSICPAVTECLENNEIRCLCWPGYEGDGNQCTEIDPCKNPNTCHEQATCTKTGPNKSNCTCNEGWVGDGYYCQVEHICMLHRDCDQNAECQLSGPGGSVCICKDGFVGDGKTCAPENPCKINNGGCHRNALCEMIGLGERECVCHPGYVGEGLSCFATIMREIQNQPDLFELSELLKDVTYFWEENEKYTFLAPNNIAVLKFKQRASSSYLQERSNILDLIAFHTLNGSYSMDTLQQMNQEMFETSAKGFNVKIVTNETNVMVTTRETSAVIVKTDILSSNGYIHIIDQVLEPFLENTARPSLSEFFSAHPEYSTFSEALLDNGLVDKLEDMNFYTLFVPDNNVIKDCSQKHGFRVLSYYILPFTLMSASMTNGLKVNTSLGQLHQLIFKTQEDQVFVNNVRITSVDVLTAGGIIHIINGCLVPVLHRCDNEVMETNKTSCISCDEEFICPPEYHKVAVLKHVCSYKTPEGELLGCTALCRRPKVTPACCYGYYGPECKECPGGADYPCSGQGSCSDGLDGTGLCSCKANFTSFDCSTSVGGDTKPDNSQKDKCGGCPHSRECKQNRDSEWSCECGDSYVFTNERECRSPCTIANGNCHQNALCSFGPEEKIKGLAKCVCRSGYHGDGINFCQPIVNLCNMNNGNCSPRAECTFIPPPANAIAVGQVKCECYPSYIGNGTTCNRDILSTLEYMPSMRLFCDLLILRDVSNDKQRSDLIQMLENINQNLTVFVPINGLDYNHNLSTQDVMNHVVARKIYIDSETEASSYKTLAGQSIRLQKSSSGELHIVQEDVVEIRIFETNILNMNGYIHIMESPLWYNYKVTAKVKEEGPHRVVGVVLGVFSVLLIILLIVLYKKYASNIFLCDIWQRYRMTSDSEISFAHLKTHESHEMLDQFEQPLTTDIQNQIYDTEELLLEERTLD